MAAVFIAPFYIIINAYIVRWIILWMGSCSHLFQSFIFRAIFVSVYIFLAASLLTGFLIKKPAKLHHTLKNIGNYFLGTFLYILIIIVTADLCHLILRYGFHTSWTQTREAFVTSGSVCTLLVLLLSTRGIRNAWKLKITPYEITVDKQTIGMNTLKIVLLADLHLGHSVGKRQVARIVRKINKQNPDLVCIAGDIFDNDYDAVDDPEEIIRCLRSIRSKYGVYACWGNHDLNEEILAGFTFSGSKSEYDDPRMKEFLQKAGIRLLNEEAVLIDGQFYLVGREDLSRAQKMNVTRKTPAQLTEELDRSKPIIFLDHQPKHLQETADAGADLNLCGHTHNGQMFPGNLFIHLFWENAYGYLKKDKMHTIVTSGTGIWGPAMRIGTVSEICPVTIHFQ